MDEKRVVLVVTVKTETRKKSQVIYSPPLGVPLRVRAYLRGSAVPGLYPNAH